MKTKKSVVKKSEVQDEVMLLAHAGTKEAVAKLEKILATEKDEDKKLTAELALEECRMFYYEPRNEKEEGDYFLLKLIYDKNERLTRRYGKLAALECEVKFAEQEFRVKKAVLEKNPKATKEENEMELWFVQDGLDSAQRDLKEIQDWIKDDENFIETAKKLITTERYKKIPEDYMEHVHFDNEVLDDSFDEEDDCCCDDCDCCGKDSCPLPNGWDEEDDLDDVDDVVKF